MDIMLVALLLVIIVPIPPVFYKFSYDIRKDINEIALSLDVICTCRYESNFGVFHKKTFCSTIHYIFFYFFNPTVICRSCGKTGHINTNEIFIPSASH